MGNTTVIIVDDHQLFREGLKVLLKNLSYIGEVLEAANGQEFLTLLGSVKPDVVFMDVSMPIMGGIEATRKAIQQYPDIQIIGLSMYTEEAYYYNMIDAGAKGFLLKNSSIQEVDNAIRHVLNGKSYFSQDILTLLIKNVNRKKNLPVNSDLSEREQAVLFQICKGLSNLEIADLMHISKRTVDKHRENILLKTGSKNTVGLVFYAIKNGIVEIE
ncbi:two component transcriptional regulator, LuxR family [Bacteroidales bacterium 6E]|nr:two component transcriptional regulator, LuxR family [Bacteroidales bacterium 6E]